jgi:fatty-acyl-CoA synthase
MRDRLMHILSGVPTSYLAMINNASFPNYNMQSIRIGVLGGASVTRQQMQRIQDTFPHTMFMTNYGQTEGACLTNTKYGDTFEHIATTVGVPMDHIRLEIQDPETKEILGPGEVGEIVVKGYNVMKGYLKPGSGPEDHRQGRVAAYGGPRNEGRRGVCPDRRPYQGYHHTGR